MEKKTECLYSRKGFVDVELISDGTYRILIHRFDVEAQTLLLNYGFDYDLESKSYFHQVDAKTDAFVNAFIQIQNYKQVVEYDLQYENSIEKLLLKNFEDGKEKNMVQKKVYISGKITDVENFMEVFADKENELTRQGYSVYNPAKHPDMFTWEQFMELDLKALSFCDSIYMMKGWENSRGAKIELEEAKRLGLEIIYETPSPDIERKNDMLPPLSRDYLKEFDDKFTEENADYKEVIKFARACIKELQEGRTVVEETVVEGRSGKVMSDIILTEEHEGKIHFCFMSEGTGDNLLSEDVEEGFVDYVMADWGVIPKEEFENLRKSGRLDELKDVAEDGSQWMLDKLYQDYPDTRTAIQDFLDSGMYVEGNAQVTDYTIYDSEGKDVTSMILEDGKGMETPENPETVENENGRKVWQVVKYNTYHGDEGFKELPEHETFEDALKEAQMLSSSCEGIGIFNLEEKTLEWSNGHFEWEPSAGFRYSEAFLERKRELLDEMLKDGLLTHEFYDSQMEKYGISTEEKAMDGKVDYHKDIAGPLTDDEKKSINKAVSNYSREHDFSVPEEDMKKFISDWKDALKESDSHSKALKLYRIFSQFEEVNYHTETQRLLEGDFGYFNERYFDEMYGSELQETKEQHSAEMDDGSEISRLDAEAEAMEKGNGLREMEEDLSDMLNEKSSILPEEKPEIEFTKEDFALAKKFIPPLQYQVIMSCIADGEEKDHFKKKLRNVIDTVREMKDKDSYDPDFQTHEMGLHYFINSSDFWISEWKDYDGEPVGFGYVVLNGDTEMSEFGDSAIKDIIDIPFIEIDLNNTDRTIEKAVHSHYPELFKDTTTKEYVLSEFSRNINDYMSREKLEFNTPNLCKAANSIFASMTKEDHDMMAKIMRKAGVNSNEKTVEFLTKVYRGDIKQILERKERKGYEGPGM